MTTLAAGSSVAVSIGKNGFLEVATNGGAGSVTITPVGGAAFTESWGPAPFRKRWSGNYPEGAAAVLSNSSSASMDYETDASKEAASGEWRNVPSIFRLRITGTGTVTMDSRDSLGNVTLNAHGPVAVVNATDQIEFPYAGDNAVQIRVTLTGNATCEVI